MANLPLMQFKCHAKYTNRVWQNAYFNASRELSHEQKMALADQAYEQAQQQK